MTRTKKIILASTLAGVVLIAGIFAYIMFRSQVTIVADSREKAPQLIEAVNGKVFEANSLPLKLPKNYSLSVFAKDLPSARVIIFDPAGRLLVSQKDQGKITVLRDKNQDGKAEEAKVLLSNLRRPHGLALKCNAQSKGCRLFVAEEHQVSVYGYDVDRVAVANKKKLADLPTGGNHTTRSLQLAVVAGKERLLVSIGSSCNVCNEKDRRRAAIISLNLDGSDQRPFAKGLRNTVFMTQRPGTTEIWGTDMGRDLLGDKLPPDEINVLAQGNPSTGSGQRNYGWPICYGKNIHDTNFDKNIYIRNPCSDTIASRIDLPAHTAPLGLAFFPSQGWPAEYRNNLLVAMHGSWNSTVSVGYKVVRIKLDDKGQFRSMEDFLTGFLTTDKRKIGRPVGLVIRPDGTIYLSDDNAGAIYRLKYTEPQVSCIKTGCSSQLCSDRPLTTTCEFKPEYACYRAAICERQADGKCGFRQTAELSACLKK